MAHTSREDLMKKLEEAKAKVKVCAKYYHWRKPDHFYEIISLGFCEWNEEICVIYRDIENETPLTWIRRLEGEDSWLTPATREDGSQTLRFQPVD